MSQSTSGDKATWKQVETYIGKVREWAEGKNFTGVYGIPRGGCVLAVMLSHALNIPMLPYPKHGCLIVDDISDSGHTLQFYKYQGYATTTMYYHKDTVTMPDFTVYEKGSEWIRFPWEVGE